ncbi:copper-binding protein [Pseudogulbenkiania sp. MAI-1]|uniref:copper-binding protein n=1 Tax=Pseudogulbenkiania sp. MAI-1 TaxID=990370 RepID=UPI00045E937C|nr:copper-binding protein [Pseudogulbenkiania sp. MAI-1]
MRFVRKLLLAAVVGMTALSPLAHAMQTPAAASTQASMLTDGEVRKIDLSANKITIKHGPIAHMDMPGMTMIFIAKDPAMLEKVKVGDKIRFMVTQENGKMVVTEIQLAN